MKKTLFTLAMFYALSSYSQPFLSTGITSKGISYNIGILSSKFETSIGIKMPILSTENATIFNFQIGRQILLTHKEEDNYSLTLKVGYAELKYKTFDSSWKETKVRTTKPIYSVELGKDAYIGRVFIKAWYCKNTFIEIGMRVFTNR